MAIEKSNNLSPPSTSKKDSIFKIKKVEDTKDLKSRFMTVGFYGLAGFLGWRYLLKPAMEKMRRSSEEKVIGNDANRQQATILHNAMNPSGISWMRSYDGTNNTAVFEAARNITDWNAVQATYKKLYARNLLSDLQSELNTNELNTFMTILNTSKARTDGGGGEIVTTKGYLIVASTDIRIRSTPDSSSGSWSASNNILGVIKQGNFIGLSTGDYQVDNKGVKYIKTAAYFINTIPASHKPIYEKLKNKTMVFWVGKGAITQHKMVKDMKEKYPAMSFDGKNVSSLGLRKDIK